MKNYVLFMLAGVLSLLTSDVCAVGTEVARGSQLLCRASRLFTVPGQDCIQAKLSDLKPKTGNWHALAILSEKKYVPIENQQELERFSPQIEVLLFVSRNIREQ